MTQAVGKAQTKSGRLGPLYDPIADELEAAEAILRTQLASQYPFVDELAKHGFRLGGKRLRPALLLLAAKAAGECSQEHLTLAAVVEMIHTATLIHDDVLDDATLRRHVETVNARWNNQTSVLLGDYLFTHAFYLASTLGDAFACQMIGRSTNIVCEGELRQIASRGNFELGEDDYLSIIEAKTAELCACCCLLGAHYAGADKAVCEALERYGRYLGISFQIVDDLLDVLGSEAATGKSLGTDLAQQKLTLPVIRLLEDAPQTERARFVGILARPENHRIEELGPWLESSGALQYARQKARSFADQARAELELLPPSPAKTVLEMLPEFVVERQQ